MGRHFYDPPFFTRTVRPLPEKRGPKSDPQRSNLYRMEREFAGWSVGTKTAVKTINSVCAHSCRRINIPPPVVIAVSKEERVFGHYQAPDTIVMNKKFHGATLHTVLHELVHHFIYHIWDDKVQDHGREFAGVYRLLLSTYKMLPDYLFDVAARRHKVSYNKYTFRDLRNAS